MTKHPSGATRTAGPGEPVIDVSDHGRRLGLAGAPGPPHRPPSHPTITFTLPDGLTAADLPDPARGKASSTPSGTVTLPTPAPLPMLRLLADWAERTGHDLPDLEVRRPTLEDAYLQLTGAKDSEITP